MSKPTSIPATKTSSPAGHEELHEQAVAKQMGRQSPEPTLEQFSHEPPAAEQTQNPKKTRIKPRSDAKKVKN